MAQPYNYTIQTPDIGQQFVQGYQQMSALTSAQQAAEARRRQLEQNKLVQEKLTALAQNPNPSAQDYVEVANLLPKDQADSLRASFETLDTSRQQGTLQFAGRTLAAFASGNNQVGRDLLYSRAEAERNSGNIEDAKFYEALAKTAEVDPLSVRDSISVMIGTLPGGKETVEASLKVADEQRKRQLAPYEIAKAQRDLDLTDAQVLKALKDVEVSDASLQKSALELAAMEAGNLPPEQRFSKELDLNKEYNKRMQSINESREAYEKIKVSAADPSGASDIALVTGFMKMLDPGSVVREGEFATARDSGGLRARLSTIEKQINSGEFLTPKQRDDFLRLAEKYMISGNKRIVDIKRSLDSLVTNYNLNPDNVFGAPKPPEEEAPLETQALPPATPTPTAQPSSVRQEADAILAGG